MKKTFLIQFLLAFLIATTSYAKTEGSYLGIEALSTKLSFYNKFNYDPGYAISHGLAYQNTAKPTYSNVNYGLGLNYKYAFNFNNFFVAPGIILEKNTFGRNPTSNGPEESNRLQVNSRYGAKVDVGYDFNKAIFSKTISPYMTVGYARVNYRIKAATLDGSSNVITTTKASGDNNLFYGAGLKLELSKNLALNLEYNYQRFTANAAIHKQSQDYLDSIKFASRLDIIKLGISYNF